MCRSRSMRGFLAGRVALDPVVCATLLSVEQEGAVSRSPQCRRIRLVAISACALLTSFCTSTTGRSERRAALVRVGVRQQARPESISKRAPSTTRTSLRFRINRLRAV